MFSVISAYQKIYPKTLMPKDKAYFYTFSDTETPHRLIPGPEDIFADYGPYKEFLLPIAQFDLSVWDKGMQVKIPLLYHESTNLDYLIYQLDDDNKVHNISFMDYKGNAYDITDEDHVYPFEEGLEEVAYPLEKFQGKYLSITPMYPLPAEIDYNDALGYSNVVTELWQKANDEVEFDSDLERYYFGPLPSLLQFSPEYPVWNGQEDAFLFVGQVDTYEFGLIGTTHFLFYHPETRTVVQLLQQT